MFGVINPGNVDGASNTSVASMMPSMLSNSSTLSSMMAYANSMNGSDMAMSWGSNIDMSSFPEWSHQYVMENVLYVHFSHLYPPVTYALCLVATRVLCLPRTPIP